MVAMRKYNCRIDIACTIINIVLTDKDKTRISDCSKAPL